MSIPVTIRAVTPADRTEWLRMRRALWFETPVSELEEEIEPFFDTGEIWRLPASVFVAERRSAGASALGGFVEVSLRPMAEGCVTSPVGYLEGWYVDEDLRRQGVGSALVKAAEQWAAERGCQEMASDCLADNDASHLAHRSLGYVASDKNIRHRKEMAPPTAVSDYLGIVPHDLSAAAAIKAVTDPRAGGVDVFLGTTRAETNESGRELIALDYEAYREMAERQLRDLAQRARQKWPIIKLVVLHRTGRVRLGEPSVIIAVSTPHRGGAFDACRWLIDALKAEVAIWKKEVWSDGSGTWVHPD